MQEPENMVESAAAAAQYWTPDYIRIAVTPTGVVMLDLKRGRYHGLGFATARELAALAENWSQVSTEAHALEPLPRERALPRAPALLRAGLLSRDPPDTALISGSVSLTAQLTSVVPRERCAPSVRLRHALDFGRACLWAKRALSSRTLYSLACEMSASTRASDAAGLQDTFDLVCIFRGLRPFAFESRDRCLFHALALRRFVSFYGAHPSWVIGVCARPWAAHSWCQFDNCVLDAMPEDVNRFTPILSI